MFSPVKQQQQQRQQQQQQRLDDRQVFSPPLPPSSPLREGFGPVSPPPHSHAQPPQQPRQSPQSRPSPAAQPSPSPQPQQQPRAPLQRRGSSKRLLGSVTVTHCDGSSMGLSWDEVVGAHGYILEHRVVPGRPEGEKGGEGEVEGEEAPFVVLGGGAQPGTTRLVQGLDPNKAHVFRVAAVVHTELCKSAPLRPLGTVSGLECRALTDAGALLAWEPPAHATRFRVEMRIADSAPGQPPHFECLAEAIADAEFEAAGLEAGQDHEFRVFAGNEHNFETVGQSVIVRPLAPVQDLAVVGMTPSTTELAWTPSPGAARYKVVLQALADPLSRAVVVADDLAEPMVVLRGLSPESEYSAVVYAGTGGGDKPVFEEQGSDVLFVPLRNVRHLRVDHVTDSSVALRWTPVQGATLYRVRWRLAPKQARAHAHAHAHHHDHDEDGDGDGEGEEDEEKDGGERHDDHAALLNDAGLLVDPQGWVTAVDTTPETSHEIGHLATGRTIEAEVLSGNEHVFLAAGPRVEGTPLAPPLGLAAVAATETSVSLAWQESAGATNYRVVMRHPGGASGGAPTVVSEVVTAVPHVVEGLLIGGLYEFAVFAGVGKVFEAQGARVGAKPLAPVHSLEVRHLSHDQVTLCWEPSPGADAYLVAYSQTHPSPPSARRGGGEGEHGEGEGEHGEEEEGPVVVASDFRVPAREKQNGVRITNLASGSPVSLKVFAGFADVFETDGRELAVTPLAPVQGLHVDSVGANSVRLKWQEVPGATKYRVQRRGKGASASQYVTVGDTAETVFAATGLGKGGDFVFRVFAGADELFETVGAEVEVTPVLPVDDLRAVARETSVALSWSPAENATRYSVEYRLLSERGAVPPTVADTTARCDAVVGSLQTGLEYEFIVRAGTDTGMASVFSRLVAVPLAAPGDLGVDVASPALATIRWTPSLGARVYSVHRRPAAGEVFECLAPAITHHTFSDGDLPEPGDYVYRVFAGAHGTFEDDGAEATAVCLPPVADLHATKVSETAVFIQWDPVPGAHRYMVCYRVKASDAGWALASDRVTGSSFQVQGLPTGKVCTLRVFAGSALGFETVGAGVDATPLSHVREIVVGEVSDSGVALSWEPVEGATSYSVEYKAKFDKAYALLSEVRGTRFSSHELGTGTTFSLRIFAGANSVWETHGQTVELTPLAPVGEMEVVHLDSASAGLRWSHVDGARKYRVRFSPAANPRDLREVLTDANEVFLADLPTGVPLDVQVAAGAGQSFESTGKSIQLTPLEPPGNLRVTSAASGSVGLAFDPVRGATAYLVEFRAVRSADAPEAGAEAEEAREGEEASPGAAFTVLSSEVTEGTYRAQGLDAATAYAFRVRAGRDGVFETQGAVVHASPLDPVVALRVSAVTASSVAVSWKPPRGATRFRVEFSEKGKDAWQQLSASQADCAAELYQGVFAGVAYSVRVFPGSWLAFGTAGASVQATPLEPPDVRVEAVDESSVTLRWGVVPGAKEYRCQELAQRGDGSPRTVRSSIVDTSLVVPGLRAGAVHLLRVTAGDGGVFESKGCVVEALPLAPVSNLAVRSVAGSSVTLAWTAVAGATRYAVHCREAHQQQQQQQQQSPGGEAVPGGGGGGGGGEWVVCTEEETGTEFTVAGLPPRLHHFVVFAGAASAFERRGARVDAVPLEGPQVVVDFVSAETVALSWKPVAGGCSRYLVDWCPTDQLPRQPQSAVAGEEGEAGDEAGKGEGGDFGEALEVSRKTSVECAGLETGRCYALRVRPVAGGCVGEGTTVLATPLAPIRDAAAKSVDARSIVLGWTPIKGATRYRAFHRNLSGDRGAGDWALISDRIRGTQININLGDAAAPLGTPYEFLLNAGDDHAFENSHTIVRVVPLASPTALAFDPLSDSAYVLSWRGVRGATQYRVERAHERAGDGHVPAALRFEPLEVVAATNHPSGEKLKRSKDHRFVGYVFRVVAGVDGCFETKGCEVRGRAFQPTQLEVASVTGSSVTLEWSGREGAASGASEAVEYTLVYRPAEVGGGGGGGGGGSGAPPKWTRCSSRPGAATQGTVGNLVAGELYEFKVFAGSRGEVEEAGSNSAFGVPLDPVFGLAATNHAKGVRLSWAAPRGATMFRVEQRFVSNTLHGDWDVVAEGVEACEFGVPDVLPFVLYAFRVFAGFEDVYEAQGAEVAMAEPFNADTGNNKEMERAVDKLVFHMLKHLDRQVPGISRITVKRSPNLYAVGDKNLNLTIQRGSVVVRVGGGYMDFALWILKHESSLLRYIATFVRGFSPDRHAHSSAAVPTLVRSPSSPAVLQRSAGPRRYSLDRLRASGNGGSFAASGGGGGGGGDLQGSRLGPNWDEWKAVSEEAEKDAAANGGGLVGDGDATPLKRSHVLTTPQTPNVMAKLGLNSFGRSPLNPTAPFMQGEKPRSRRSVGN